GDNHQSNDECIFNKRRSGEFFSQLKISMPKEELYEAKKRLLEVITSFSKRENFAKIFSVPSFS
ncbi:MAG: hypothetical protein LBC04_02245, partial [Holosporaceae bacterium]|nr:hypothetical protein [Holosporaceae bacterium]